MEIALRRLDGVDKVAISIERQAFVVLYKPGASFRPDDLRDAVAKAEVSVVQFHIQARGRVQVEGAKRFFVAGKDRFLLVSSSKVAADKMPADTPLLVGGDIDDAASPLQLRVTEFKPLDKPTDKPMDKP